MVLIIQVHWVVVLTFSICFQLFLAIGSCLSLHLVYNVIICLLSITLSHNLTPMKLAPVSILTLWRGREAVLCGRTWNAPSPALLVRSRYFVNNFFTSTTLCASRVCLVCIFFTVGCKNTCEFYYLLKLSMH